MTSVMAPVLPYLAEEIYSTLHEGDEPALQLSVFAKKWAPVVSVNVGTAWLSLMFPTLQSAEWSDPEAESDMTSLLKIRSVVLSLLENARGDK